MLWKCWCVEIKFRYKKIICIQFSLNYAIHIVKDTLGHKIKPVFSRWYMPTSQSSLVYICLGLRISLIGIIETINIFRWRVIKINRKVLYDNISFKFYLWSLYVIQGINLVRNDIMRYNTFRLTVCDFVLARRDIIAC